MGNNNSKKNMTPEQLEEMRIARERKKAEKEESERAAAAAAAKKKRNKVIITCAISAVLLMAIVFSIVGCSIAEARKKDSCEYFRTRDVEGREVYYAKMTVRDYGDIVLLLDATSAPITVANFVKLVNQGFYNGLTFHRIMSGFMIQGGDPNADGSGNASEQIKGEFSENGWNNDILHKDGVISMARGGYSMNSASCQFFICNATNLNVTQSLDGKYAAFGYIIAGLPIVHKITETTEKYATGSNNTITDKSKQAVIESIQIIGEEEALRYTK